MRRRLYHTHILLISVFCLLTSGAHALEQKKISEVWPIGQRQQYFYYYEDHLIGESWMEIREVPRSDGERFEMLNTIDIDGTPFGSIMKIEGHSLAELDPWGRPIAYELELDRPNGLTTMEVLFSHPMAEMRIIGPNGERVEQAHYHEESLILDFVFIGPFDLAFRLDPVHPSASEFKRNYFVPQLEVNIYAPLYVDYEEEVTLDDGTTHDTVKVRFPSVLTDVWLGPKGQVLKAVVVSESLEMRAGTTETP